MCFGCVFFVCVFFTRVPRKKKHSLTTYFFSKKAKLFHLHLRKKPTPGLPRSETKKGRGFNVANVVLLLLLVLFRKCFHHMCSLSGSLLFVFSFWTHTAWRQFSETERHLHKTRLGASLTWRSLSGPLTSRATVCFVFEPLSAPLAEPHMWLCC